MAFTLQAITQNVWENTNTEVHPFLYRMAQKGFIEYEDLIKPINRINVLNALNILKQYSAEFNEIGKVPMKHKDSIFNAYRSALNSHYEKLKKKLIKQQIIMIVLNSQLNSAFLFQTHKLYQ